MPKIWAISDTHFPRNSMNKFGEQWINHRNRIIENICNKLRPGDTLLMPGDIVNTKYLETMLKEISAITSLKINIVISPGNHDKWISEVKDHMETIPENVFISDCDTIIIDNIAICGCVFWCFESAFPWEGQYANMDNLQAYQSKALKDLSCCLSKLSSVNNDITTKILLLHFPPISDKGIETIYSNFISESNIDYCVYGHAHGVKQKVEGCETTLGNTKFLFVTSDYLNMDPLLVLEY